MSKTAVEDNWSTSRGLREITYQAIAYIDVYFFGGGMTRSVSARLSSLQLRGSYIIFIHIMSETNRNDIILCFGVAAVCILLLYRYIHIIANVENIILYYYLLRCEPISNYACSYKHVLFIGATYSGVVADGSTTHRRSGA